MFFLGFFGSAFGAALIVTSVSALIMRMGVPLTPTFVSIATSAVLLTTVGLICAVSYLPRFDTLRGFRNYAPGITIFLIILLAIKLAFNLYDPGPMV